MKNHKLRAARAKMHWSMEVTAEKIGVSKTSIARWENGEQKPRGASLDLVCAAYRMSAEELDLVSSVLDDTPTLPTPTQDNITIVLTAEQVNKLSILLETEHNNMRYFDSSKRKTLQQLLETISTTAIASQITTNSGAWERLIHSTTKPSSMNLEAFNHFQRLLDVCWGLTNNGEMSIAEQTLANFLPRTIYLAQHSPDAATLAAQGLRLQSILKVHQLRVVDMIMLCQKAVEYARVANNYSTLSASLDSLAIAYKYAYKQEESFKTYQEAVYYSDKASPLVRSRLYAASAATLAQRGRTQEAFFYIRLAYENFPNNPESETDFLSADNGMFMIAYYEGLMYLAMRQPKKAEEAFESYKKYPSTISIPERNRIEIINHRGRAAIQANNLEQYSFCLEEGLLGTIAIQSKKRFDEAFNIYHQEIPKEWLQERRIKQIAESFQLER